MDRKLYADGEPKTQWRGWLHAGMVPVYVVLWCRPWDAYMSFFLATQGVCYAVSAMYHRIPWSRRAEMVILKCDLCCISLYECGSYVPLCAYVLPPPLAACFGCTLLVTTLSHWHHVWYPTPGFFGPFPLHLFIVGASVVPFLPALLPRMTPYEIACMVATVVAQVTGMLIFTYRAPNPIPHVWGVSRGISPAGRGRGVDVLPRQREHVPEKNVTQGILSSQNDIGYQVLVREGSRVEAYIISLYEPIRCGH
jgi:hemolysin III